MTAIADASPRFAPLMAKCGNYAEANRLKDVMESDKRAEKALRETSRK